MKKVLLLTVGMLCIATVFAACGSSADGRDEPTAEATIVQGAEVEEAVAEEAEPEGFATNETRPYIALISKGFQHQFWQTVLTGSRDAAEKYNVEISFEGPQSESDISIQVDMVADALASSPDALGLAALDTSALNEQLEEARDNGIPVIGFDSGVPDAPEGSVVSTASTDNYAAGALAAEKMFEHPDVLRSIQKAATYAPVTIVVQSQDADSASILDRTNGFIDRMTELCETVQPELVEVVGHSAFERGTDGKAAVSIKVTIPPSTSYADARNACQTMLQNTNDLVGYFASNEASALGVLAATNEGADLDRMRGLYKELVVVGFDAGVPQKDAVAKKYFYGSVTQDPYSIGYLAVELAYKAINGEELEQLVDTGCQFYTSENMEDEDIAQLLYD